MKYARTPLVLQISLCLPLEAITGTEQQSLGNASGSGSVLTMTTRRRLSRTSLLDAIIPSRRACWCIPVIVEMGSFFLIKDY